MRRALTSQEIITAEQQRLQGNPAPWAKRRRVYLYLCAQWQIINDNYPDDWHTWPPEIAALSVHYWVAACAYFDLIAEDKATPENLSLEITQH